MANKNLNELLRKLNEQHEQAADSSVENLSKEFAQQITGGLNNPTNSNGTCNGSNNTSCSNGTCNGSTNTGCSNGTCGPLQAEVPIDSIAF